jgi:putative YphP/YqiW family bacilliredoxin
MQPLYDPEAVRYMWEELESVGVRSMRTPEEVDEAINEKGTTLLVINSVCGCAAGHARPGIGLALQHKVIPDHLVTVFAGVDREATQRAREHMPGITPSSPSAALFENGKLVYVLHRSRIETMGAEEVAGNLRRAFESYCSRPGPSVPGDVFERSFAPARCSSEIPRYEEEYLQRTGAGVLTGTSSCQIQLDAAGSRPIFMIVSRLYYIASTVDVT